MRITLLLTAFILVFTETIHSQSFPNPSTLSTGQGAPGTLDPIWTVSQWFSSSPPNPMGLAYSPALINNNCAAGSWVNPASLPPPTNNGNWITGSSTPCNSNTNDGYLYFRLALNLPADCNGNSVATTGSYTLYLSGFVDNTISDVFINGNSTGISGGSYSSGSQLNMTLSGPWVAGMNYVDVLVYNFPNGGNANPYGLLLVANSAASSVADGDGDGVADINDQCPCTPGILANGCNPVAITGDTVICVGESTTLTVTGNGTFYWNNGSTASSITVSPLTTTRYSAVATASNGYTDSAVVNVTVNPLPPVSVNPATPAICIGNSVTLTATGAGTYGWSDGSTNAALTVSPGITSPYSVTGTDVNGCSATAGSTVTVNPLPTPAINPAATAICAGDNTTLTASGGTGYAWSNAATTAAITVSPVNTTTYTVTVTDANTCSASTSSTVTVNPLPVPVINPASATICIGGSATLTAGGGTTYMWSDGTSTPGLTVSPISTTTYSVTVTDANTCSATTDATVTVNPLPVPVINPASATICDGNSATLTASGGTGYVWSNAANTAAITVSPNTTTTYAVTVTDANTCSATTSADVTVNPLPVAVINPPGVTICNGDNTTLTATGGTTYLWSDGSSSAAITVMPNLSTVYSVTTTDANTCTASASETVAVIPTMMLTPTKTDVSCNGGNDGAINLFVSSGQTPYTYLWSTNATVEDLVGLAAGNYNVTVTDNAGCSATTSENINEPAILALTSSSENPSCESVADNGTISLSLTGGTTPYQYSWSGGLNGANPVSVGPGNYDVTVSDANNCTTGASFVLAYIYDFSIEATPSVSIKLGESALIGYTLTGNAGNFTAVWSPSSTLSCSDCVTPLASPNLTTLYQIEVKNDVGCVATDEVTVTVVPDYSVFVPNVFTPNNDGNNDFFKISGILKSLEFLQIQIFNRAGEKVFESQDHDFSWDGTYKGVLQNPAVFTWQMKLTFMDGHREELRKGTLTLLR